MQNSRKISSLKFKGKKDNQSLENSSVVNSKKKSMGIKVLI